MLSDDEIWSRWKFPADLSWKEAVIALARAIEREARRQALEEDVPKYTEGHCRYKKLPAGCPLHNIQCGYPNCDRRPASATKPPSVQPDADEALRWEKPGPVSPNHPLECLIVLSALRQSDGDWWIEGSKFLADDLPIAWAPDTPEARAVLAAQGGDL